MVYHSNASAQLSFRRANEAEEVIINSSCHLVGMSNSASNCCLYKMTEHARKTIQFVFFLSLHTFSIALFYPCFYAHRALWPRQGDSFCPITLIKDNYTHTIFVLHFPVNLTKFSVEFPLFSLFTMSMRPDTFNTRVSICDRFPANGNISLFSFDCISCEREIRWCVLSRISFTLIRSACAIIFQIGHCH